MWKVRYHDSVVAGTGLAILSTTAGDNVNASASNNIINWNIDVELDTASFTHSTSTNPSRIYCLNAGSYSISGSVVLVSSLLTVWSGSLKLRKNGSTVFAYGKPALSYLPVVAGNVKASIDFEWMLDFAANDYFEILCDRENSLTGSITTSDNQSICNVLRL